MLAKGKRHKPIHRTFNPSRPLNEYKIELVRGMKGKISTHT